MIMNDNNFLNTFDYKDRDFQRLSFISDLFWGPQKAVRLPLVPLSKPLVEIPSPSHVFLTRNPGRQRLAVRNFLYQLPHRPQVAAKNFRLGFSILQGPIKCEGQPRDASQDVSGHKAKKSKNVKLQDVQPS